MNTPCSHLSQKHGIGLKFWRHKHDDNPVDELNPFKGGETHVEKYTIQNWQGNILQKYLEALYLFFIQCNFAMYSKFHSRLSTKLFEPISGSKSTNWTTGGTYASRLCLEVHFCNTRYQEVNHVRRTVPTLSTDVSLNTKDPSMSRNTRNPVRRFSLKCKNHCFITDIGQNLLIHIR